ncbi:MAG: helix-hairpin-helix domain-containing protein, partial [Anaerolineae bacterium]
TDILKEVGGEQPAEGEVPDWLSGLEEEAPAEEAPAAEQPTLEGEVPDWLSGLEEEASAEEAPTAEQPTLESEVPDWLSGLGEEQAEAREGLQEAAPVSERVPMSEEPLPPEEKPTDETPSAEPPVDLSDPDAAMAWLESLAAKRGVPEEELVTRPEDRPQVTPDWQPVSETPAPSPEEAGAEDKGPAEESPTPAWLREIEEQAPAAEEETPTPEWLQETESEAATEEQPIEGGEWPEWLQVEETPAAESKPLAEAESEAEETLPEWLQEAETPMAEIAEEPAAETPPPAGDVPEWLAESAMAAPIEPPAAEAPEEVEAAPEQPQPEAESAAPEAGEPAAAEPAPAAEEELPEWLRRAEASPTLEEAVESTLEEIPDWVEGAAEEAPPPDATWIVEFGKDVPSRAEIQAEIEARQPAEAPAPAEGKLDLNSATLTELERLPGMGFRRAQLVFSYREAHGPYKDFQAVRRVPGLDDEAVAILQQYTEIRTPAPATAAPAPQPQPQPKAPLPEMPATPKDDYHARHLAARQHLQSGQLGAALNIYAWLIKKGKRLEEVATDLEYAAGQYPDNPDVLQTLGDAYTRLDRLQEALDTYTRVEQLLSQQ